MHDVTLRLLASAFVDIDSVSPATPSLLPGLMACVASYGMVPTLARELPNPEALATRFAFTTFDNTLQVLLGTKRIDVTRRVATTDAASVAETGQFLMQASDILARLLTHLDRRCHRLAFVDEGMLGEMPPARIDAIAANLLGRGSIHQSWGSPFEWDYRTAHRVTRSFGDRREATNTILTVKRLTGTIALRDSESPRPFDRLRVDLDINTAPDTVDDRFGKADIEAFFGSVGAWHAELAVYATSIMGLEELSA